VLLQLQQIKRVSETEWETKNVLPVSFALLVSPSKDGKGDIIELRMCFAYRISVWYRVSA